MENQITVNPKDFNLEKEQALQLTSGLTSIYEERETLKNAFIDVIDLEVNEENLSTFGDLRKAFVKNRTQGFEKWHKVNKEFFLTGGRFVDAIKNKEIAENGNYENQLLAKEKHFENIEKQRLQAVKLEREALIAPFGYDFTNVDLSSMDANMFEMILTGAKKTHEDKVIAEQKAEAERIETARLETERLENQRLENERLKAENDLKEKQIELERIESAKRETELKAKADLEAKKQAEILAKQKAENDAKLKIEADKLAAVQSELKSKADAEIAEKKRLADLETKRLADEKKAAKAPDKMKLTKNLDSLVFVIQNELSTQDAVNVQSLVSEKFAAFKLWAQTQINTL